MTSFDASTWATTTTDMESNPPPPEGDYVASLTAARAFTANSGSDYVVLTWLVASGPQAGYQWDVVYGFGSPGAFKALKATLANLGVDVDSLRSLDQMDAALKGAQDTAYAVAVKRNGDFTNTYCNGPTTVAQPVTQQHTDVPAPTADFAPAPTQAGVPMNEVPF